MLRKLLESLGRQVVTHPRRIIVAYGVAAVASVLGALLLLEFKTDQNDLVAADLEYNQRYLRFLEEFADLEFLYVVIRVNDDADRAVRVADAVVEELEPLKAEGHVQSVFHRVPLDEIGYGLLFQDHTDLQQLAHWLEGNRELLTKLGSVDRFERLLEVFAASFDTASLAQGDPGDGEFAEWGFRLLDVALVSMDDALQNRRVDPLDTLLEQSAGLTLRERGYLATEGDRLLLVEVQTAKDTETVELIREPLLAIRAALARVRERHPGVELGLTGRPVFQADEMMTTDRDMRRATVASLIGVFVLFVIFFRRLARPFLAVTTLAIAVLLTFGVVSVTIGYLTILTIVFAAMLVGLGIDFGIHFVARYQEELAAGKTVRDAIRTTLETTGVGIGTGALTTAAAFFTTLLVDFAGLRELGFIAGVGVILCFLAMVTLLPVLLLITDGRKKDPAALRRVTPPSVPLLDRVCRVPILAIAVLLTVSVVALIRFQTPRYNPNLLDLQATGLESVDYEMLLIEESEKATWYAAFVTGNLEETREVVRKLEPLIEPGIVGSIESPLDVLPRGQEGKLEVLARGATAVADIAIASASSEVDADSLASTCEELLDDLDDLQSVLAQREDDESRAALRQLSNLTDRLDNIVTQLGDEADTSQERLAPVQQRWFGELGALLGKLRAALRQRPLAPSSLPSILRSRFVSKDGKKLLVYAYPRKDIWDETNMKEFIDAIVAIAPEVTGTPIQVYESSRRMRDGFVQAGLYSLLVVFLLLLLDLRSLPMVLLAMVPLIAGLLWLLEALPWLGLDFNLANFFAVPILIGCGIDGGVHAVHRFRESRSSSDVSRTTCAAVTLSLLTTMIGFGTMSFASHQGVASLGRMMVAGLACLLVATVVLLPSILALVERRRTRLGG